MARYDYHCRKCHAWYEIERSIHDPEESLSCPDCFSTLRRVYGPVGVQFKGSGWTKNSREVSDL